MRTGTEQSQPEDELTVAEVDRVIEVVLEMAEPPELPEREADLWGEALKQAEEALRKDLKERAAQVTHGPGMVMPPRKATRAENTQFEARCRAAVQERAEKVYLELDLDHAAAVQAARGGTDKQVQRLDVLLTPEYAQWPNAGKGGHGTEGRRTAGFGRRQPGNGMREASRLE